MATEDNPGVTPLTCVCAACGHEQSSMIPCDRCRSVRVVLISVLREILGDEWRGAFAPDPAPLVDARGTR